MKTKTKGILAVIFLGVILITSTITMAI